MNIFYFIIIYLKTNKGIKVSNSILLSVFILRMDPFHNYDDNYGQFIIIDADYYKTDYTELYSRIKKTKKTNRPAKPMNMSSYLDHRKIVTKNSLNIYKYCDDKYNSTINVICIIFTYAVTYAYGFFN